MLGTEAGRSVRAVIRSRGTDVHAPALCDVEVVAGLRRGIMRRALSRGRAANAVEDYVDLPITRHGHQQLLTRMIALGENFTAYDACYVALAEVLGAELLTADGHLARAVRSHTRVHVLA